MPERVRITDVSPRDGLQNEPAPIDTRDKINLIERLAVTGVDEIELTSFVSPKWVPQLADAEDVVGAIAEFAEGVRLVAGELPRGVGRQGRAALPVFSVLVPNETGFERALAAHESGLPLKIALFASASETFSQKNTNGSIDQVLERFTPILPRAREAEMPVRLYVSCAIACPFEGPIAPERVRDVCDRLLALAHNAGFTDDDPPELDLADTIGVAHPDEIAALMGVFSDDERAKLTLHLHDTHGRAAACVSTALGLGVRSFDGAASGLGGCPYASTDGQRAPGNIATELLVRTVHDAGYATSVDEALLEEAGAFAAGLVARDAQGGDGSNGNDPA
jgi:hydroxymethylglutaryl-CoA lyase